MEVVAAVYQVLGGQQAAPFCLSRIGHHEVASGVMRAWGQGIAGSNPAPGRVRDRVHSAAYVVLLLLVLIVMVAMGVRRHGHAAGSGPRAAMRAILFRVVDCCSFWLHV
ncbi:hypothetical protein GCM10010430_55660 [Kitasatospora cystarginea]|uniref:Uncharacterized protein n=1 Tax=Kitasatospora cystarginea TaxID=58350 RepID=A0ABP5RJI0_9ACTN